MSHALNDLREADFVVELHASGKDGVQLVFRHIDPAESCGTSEALLALVRAHGTCMCCNEPVIDFTAHASCEGDRKSWWPGEIAVHMSTELYAQVSARMKLERHRYKAWERRRRMKRSGGSHSASETRKLFELQEGRCYYCFDPLHDGAGTVSLHKDHYVSVLLGGTDCITNIVLTCPSCNARKANQDGSYFENHMARKADAEIRVGLRRIRKARRNAGLGLALALPSP